jgi:transcription-repair coupling factor (superfamily II helicase)
LGLVIIDEEQRFGVMQKEKFKKLRGTVDVLSMSATPIPRTLYMALTEIRDMSIITDPPPGRLPIRTVVAPYTDWMVREAILRELQRDGQVFYVVPRIQGIMHVAERLQGLVPHARIAVAHGQMPPQEVEATVLAFYNREHDVLVSTTIIENGLDMPNVNTLIVEGAERFGLGQLYQLRGRVGRSDRQAYAYFLYRAGKLSEKAEDRLQALREFSHLGSGFALAMRDLEIRGAGNLLGEEQHGAMRSVGLELYQTMLRDAIRRLRQGETHWSLDAPVEEELPDASKLPVHAYIPHDYIQDVAQRLGYYKRIAGSRTREELKSLVRELRDRYGELPAPLKNLIRLMEQRILAHALGVQTIGIEDKRLVLRFKPDRKLKARWQLALQQAIRGVRTQPDELSAPLGEHPLETLMQVLGELKACVEA